MPVMTTRKSTAKSTKTHVVGGRVVSAKSKTGDPACSQAMSSWKTSGMTAAIAAVLGKCRAKAKALKESVMHRAAGNVAGAAKRERLARISAGGEKPIAASARTERAKELVKARMKKKAAPKGPSLKEQAAQHRAAKGTREARVESLHKRRLELNRADFARDNLERMNVRSKRISRLASPEEKPATTRGTQASRGVRAARDEANLAKGQAANRRLTGVTGPPRSTILGAPIGLAAPKAPTLREQAAANRGEVPKATVAAAAKLDKARAKTAAAKPPGVSDTAFKAAMARRGRLERLGAKTDVDKGRMVGERISAIDTARAKLAAGRAARMAKTGSEHRVTEAHVDRLHDAFDAIDATGAQKNWVPVYKIREKFPDLSHEEFKQLIRDAREKHGYFADAFEGRFGELPAAARENRIRDYEGGRGIDYLLRTEYGQPPKKKKRA